MDHRISQEVEHSPFDLRHQQDEIESKIVVALERIAEVFRFLLWEKAKTLSLSPIQIQILIFLRHHSEEKSKVSYLSKEFNLTKPTISDSILALEKKKLIYREPDKSDSRSFTFKLTPQGKETVSLTEDFANPLKKIVSEISDNEKALIWKILSESIFKLNRTGVISVQRMCFNCKFYQENQGQSHCLLLNQTLETKDLRIDCPEFIEIDVEM